MGAIIKEEHGFLDCCVPSQLKGANITLSFPSVGATENIILAAVLANGDTEIRNAAREPEIIDLAKFLNRCGAKISGFGESTIIIKGVSELNGCDYSEMPDRIVTATYLGAAAITNGELCVRKTNIKDIESVIPVFEQMGCMVYSYSDKIYINAVKPLKAVKTIRTMPYPGFPTDVQAIISACLCKAKGTSIIVENIFENRFRHAGELSRMGADIKVEGKVAVIEGVSTLYGANVQSTDLRGGAALVLAGLCAEGKTTVSEIRHIDRGYESIEANLNKIGAKIVRI
jgi:UDP-N-acetylglucosamine 1-carboxyvinyltransferase